MTEKRLILAHDLGTTGNKATLFDADGALLDSAFCGYETDYPYPNWAEQDPVSWWRAVCTTSRQLLARTGADPAAIAAIGFSGQMMGVVPVGPDGQPLRSCIIWADQRAQAQAAEMEERCGGDEVYRRSGHRASPAYTAPKIMWLRDEQSEIYRRAVRFFHPKDYIVYRLTGVSATDFSDASGTLVFDLVGRDWIQPFLDRLSLEREQLPLLHRSTDVVGELTREAAEATGIAAGTPVVIGGGDGSCAGGGAAVIEPGDAYCNIGASAWISIASMQPVIDPAQRTVTFHHIHAERYCPMGTMQAAGGARQWAWEMLSDGVLDLDEAALTSPPGANGLIFLPHLMGERSPYWNPLARGAYVGLARSHTKADLARATLEGVVYNLRLILDALRAQVAGIDAMRFIGGGSRSPLWRQILADVFDMPVHTLELQAGATSWGAAVAAGVGVGLFDWSIAGERSQVVSTAEPIPDSVAFYDEQVALFSDVYAALEPSFRHLAALQGG
jgi:xylulokinase